MCYIDLADLELTDYYSAACMLELKLCTTIPVLLSAPFSSLYFYMLLEGGGFPWVILAFLDLYCKPS